MPAEHKHRSRIKKRYTIILLPETEPGTPKRLTLSITGFVLAGVGIMALALLTVFVTWTYTPMGVYIPIPNPELENRYHRQIVSIQDRLTKLTEDLTFLREYNIRLRRALGENLPAGDSAFAALLQTTTRAPAGSSAQPTARQSDIESPAQGSSGLGRSPGQAPGYSPLTTMVTFAEPELPLTVPVRGYVTQEFSPDQQHFGIDFAGKIGTPVFAAAGGSVVFAGWTYEDGYMMMIAHGRGYQTTYKHNQSLLKSAGDYVRRGEPIALLGNSGKTSYGPHLHFEVWKDGTVLDPRTLLLANP